MVHKRKNKVLLCELFPFIVVLNYAAQTHTKLVGVCHLLMELFALKKTSNLVGQRPNGFRANSFNLLYYKDICTYSI